MMRQYGKIPRGSKAQQPQLPRYLTVQIHGRHTLEQFSLELQKMIARLQEHDVEGIQGFTATLEPLDQQAQLKILWHGEEPVTRLDINAPPSPPPYRES